uniref:Uncharacterized protein n=1 Tax=Rhizophora mucronata TaxID=61149 RepID=A0A2P2PF00_RHIMU
MVNPLIEILLMIRISA